jgi:hypothetical protein
VKLKLIVAVAVVLAGSVAYSQPPDALKLEGAWVARVTSYEGAEYPYVSQWSYVLQPADPSGRRFTLHGSIDLKFPQMTPANVFNSPLIAECAVTGPDTAKCFAIWYHVQKGNPLDEILYIGTVDSDVTRLGPGRYEVTHHFAIYPPGADADGDGIPETGSPIQTFTVTTRDTRLPQPVVR